MAIERPRLNRALGSDMVQVSLAVNAAMQSAAAALAVAGYCAFAFVLAPGLSVLTCGILAAVGMAGEYVPVMVVAILMAVAVMLLAARPLGQFIDRNPTIKMLALAFIVLIGVYLTADGFEMHIPKGYIYGAMGFSALVEVLNLWAKRRARLRERME